MPKTSRSKTKNRVDKYQATTDKILKLLESDLKPWIKPWSATPYQNLISKNIYKGCNPIICTADMMLNEWKDPYFLTFNQAKEKNWTVKKGSKATNILFASSYTRTVENEKGEEQETQGWAHKWFNVFNVACIDDSESDEKIAEEIEKVQQHLPINTDSPIEKVEQFVAKQNANITFGGDRACYSPSLDRIRMPKFENFTDAESFYATKIHELIHRTGHKTRLDRDQTGSFGSKKYAFEELIAELGSAFVSNELMTGWDLKLENHASYLASWIKLLKEDNRAFFRAASAAQKAADFLFDRHK